MVLCSRDAIVRSLALEGVYCLVKLLAPCSAEAEAVKPNATNVARFLHRELEGGKAMVKQLIMVYKKNLSTHHGR